MKFKPLTVVLVVITVCTLAWSIYTWERIRHLEKESEIWKAKYEEALIDTEEAVQRMRALEQQMAEALATAEREKNELLKQLEQLKKNKAAR
ncbi:MAG: hypothetical protein KatS3mg032_1484 [Cyclobacteriaceae bacterium]|nr:MAG: hypothetical protein KatS3mg032_1484 [Cyclobacteriaceae bacterium]